MKHEEAELLAQKYVMEAKLAEREYRNTVIEECARVAEDYYHTPTLRESMKAVGAAIRALKQRQP